jgi:hypothetical protein
VNKGRACNEAKRNWPRGPPKRGDARLRRHAVGGLLRIVEPRRVKRTFITRDQNPMSKSKSLESVDELDVDDVKLICGRVITGRGT